MVTFKKLAVEIVLPLIVFALIVSLVFGKTGLGNNVKDLVMGVSKYGPDVEVGLDELEGGKATLEEGHTSSVNGLRSTINRMLQSSENNCFDKFGGFGSVLGDGDKTASVSMVFETGKTSFFIKNKFGQTVEIFEIDGMQPCVVAGTEEITKNFFEYYIEKKGNRKNPYYKQVNGINIIYQEDGLNGNAIRVPEFQDSAVNDEGENFESNGYLFKGSNNEICFFPTNKVYDHDEDGIANEWFNAGVTNSIPSQIQKDPGLKC